MAEGRLCLRTDAATRQAVMIIVGECYLELSAATNAASW